MCGPTDQQILAQYSQPYSGSYISGSRELVGVSLRIRLPSTNVLSEEVEED